MAWATNNEALAEFARNAGMMAPERAWLLSEWDVWVANPFYNGPAVPHPEDDTGGLLAGDDDDIVDDGDSEGADGEWLASAGMGTDEDYGDFGCNDDIPY